MSIELETHIRLGTQYLFDMHDPDRAIDEFSRALAIDPACLVAFVYRNFAFAELKQFPKALADLNQALRLCPDDPRLYNYRADVRIELHDFAGAYDDLCDAMQLDGDVHLLWRRGYVALKLRKLQQAAEDYTEILLMIPDDACAYNNRGLAYMGLGDLERAMLDFNKSIELNPDHPDHHNSRARLYVLIGNDEKAKADSLTAIETCDRVFDPDLGDDIVWNDRAEALLRLGRYDEAIKCSEDVLKIKPNDPEAWRYLGEAHAMMGKNEDALKCFDKSIEIDADPEVLLQRADLLEKLGDVANAKRDRDLATKSGGSISPHGSL